MLIHYETLYAPVQGKLTCFLQPSPNTPFFLLQLSTVLHNKHWSWLLLSNTTAACMGLTALLEGTQAVTLEERMKVPLTIQLFLHLQSWVPGCPWTLCWNIPLIASTARGASCCEFRTLNQDLIVGLHKSHHHSAVVFDALYYARCWMAHLDDWRVLGGWA